MISTMLSGAEPDRVLLDLDVRVQRVDRLLGGVDLRHADPLARVDHLALQVRQVDLVVVDDPERAHARPRPDTAPPANPGRRRRAAARGVEQLLLPVHADLGEKQVAGVALALLGGERARRLDLVTAILPKREAPGHRLDVLVTEVLDQRASGPGRAVARRAVQDHVLVAIGDGALDPRLEIALGYVDRAGDVPGRPLLGLTDVDDHRAVADLLVHGGGIDLIDPALDLAENLRSGRAHRRKLLKCGMDSILQRV